MLGVLALNITDCPDPGPPHAGAASLLHAASAAVQQLMSPGSRIGGQFVMEATMAQRFGIELSCADLLSMRLGHSSANDWESLLAVA